MRNIKTVQVDKSDVAKLSKTDLNALLDWSKHDGYEVMVALAKEEIERSMEAATAEVIIDAEAAKIALSGITYLKQALNYIMSASNRAEEELKKRGKES